MAKALSNVNKAETNTVQFNPDEYRHEGNAVCLLNYQFVWVSKRKKKVLVGDVARRLEEIIYEICAENRWKVTTLQIMADHVHLILNTHATDAPGEIVRKIRYRASHHLRQEFPELLKIPTLWAPSYYVSNAGNIPTETIKNYLANQKV